MFGTESLRNARLFFFVILLHNLLYLVESWRKPEEYHHRDEEGYWLATGPATSFGLKPPPKLGTPEAESFDARHLVRGYWLDEAAKEELGDAKCLDGSSGLYYHRPGWGDGARKWLIHHQGGGWCQSLNCTPAHLFPDDLDSAPQGEKHCPADSCYTRAGGALGSTAHDRPSMSLRGGYFDIDPQVNPSFHNWNMAFLRYCDGGSFTGNRPGTVRVGDTFLHFRGFALLKAMQRDLLYNRGLREAEDVVVSGCSAGGLATFLHLDQWNSILKQECLKNVNVVGMPDSGFFLDHLDKEKLYHLGMRFVFEEFQSEAGVDQGCIDAHSKGALDNRWKCIFAQYTAPFITTPLFALQSQYDSWQLSQDLNSKNLADINLWGKSLIALINSTLLQHNDQHAVFLDSCAHHCGQWGNLWAPTSEGKVNQPMAFQQWYHKVVKDVPIDQQMYGQIEHYPCIECCGGKMDEFTDDLISGTLILAIFVPIVCICLFKYFRPAAMRVPAAARVVPASKVKSAVVYM